MADDPSSVIDSARKGIQNADSFGQWVRDVLIGGPIRALAISLVGGIMAFGDAVRAPFIALFGGLSDTLGATFFNLVDILDAGGATSAASFADGAAASLGPFAFLAAMVVVIAALWLVSFAWDQVDFSLGGLFGRIRR
jgi:hypothetical protein